MAERTPQQQAQFDAAELINQSKASLSPADKVALKVQNARSGTKTTVKGEE